MGEKPVAFVAMKFEGDPWNDKRFGILRDVLEEAGYDVKRGDALRSSAAVMHEVFQYLKTSAMVVVDTTGDSHNVSYELGYCHGIERDPGGVILLRSQTDSPVPFNYAHYRHLHYKDMRHLRRLLRERLNISIPLSGGDLAWVMQFDQGKVTEYGTPIAQSVVQALRAQGFVGRCEYYAGNTFMGPADYVVAVGLKKSKRPYNKFGAQWFRKLEGHLVEALKDNPNGAIGLESDLSEFTTLQGVSETLLLYGVLQFHEDGTVALLNQDEEDPWLPLPGIAGLGGKS